MYAEEDFLAELPGIVRVPDHAVHHVPAQVLVLAHQAFERPGLAGQDVAGQGEVGGDRIGEGRGWMDIPL